MSNSHNISPDNRISNDPSTSKQQFEGDMKETLSMQHVPTHSVQKEVDKKRIFNFDTLEISSYHNPPRKIFISPSNSLQQGSSSSTIRLIDKILADPQYFDKKTIDTKFEKRFKKVKYDGCNQTDRKQKEKLHPSESERKSRKSKTRHRSKFAMQSNSSHSSDSCSSPKVAVSHSSKYVRPRLKSRSRSLDTFNLPVNPSEASRRKEFRAEVDESGLSKQNGVDSFPNKGKTRAILNRLDSVLSDLVEKEKRRIQYLEVPNRKLRDRSLDSQPRLRQTALDVTSLKRPRSSQSITKRKALPRRPTPADVMEQHKEWFTELKPYRPRILKSEIKAKLLSYRCYQKPKRLKQSETEIEATQNTVDDSSSTAQQVAVASVDEIEEDIVTDSNNNANNDDEVNVSDVGKRKQEDDDDTCYGSDMVQSDSFPDKFPEQLQVLPKYETSNDGEFSIDSAYNGSREATPDLHNKCLKPNTEIKGTPYREDTFQSYNAVFSSSPAKRIEQGRSFILGEIKKMGLYSDQDINMRLSEYQAKWDHVPERELSIITKSIRRDLGVQAPPKECVNQLLSASSYSNKGLENILSRPSFSLSSSESKRECIQALTRTLPFHSRNTQKPSIQFCDYTLSQKAKSGTDMHVNTPSRLGNTTNTSISPSEPGNPWEIHDPDISHEIQDEVWAKSVLGSDSYLVEEAKKALGDRSDISADWNNLTEELCNKFDLQL